MQLWAISYPNTELFFTQKERQFNFLAHHVFIHITADHSCKSAVALAKGDGGDDYGLLQKPSNFSE
jgi:hypothetical protein